MRRNNSRINEIESDLTEMGYSVTTYNVDLATLPDRECCVLSAANKDTKKLYRKDHLNAFFILFSVCFGLLLLSPGFGCVDTDDSTIKLASI
mmetsp:Transcript_43784/g.105607  ORF Transcript_43784/g.105607 Transcript_43784/m.105607 type:complete len:92 (+) Transcript_43784:17-292(+)